MKINKKKLISWIPRIAVIVIMLVLINTQLYQSQILDTLEYGFVFALLALGIFISFRILDIPDLSVDGTFALGVSVSAIVASDGHPILGIFLVDQFGNFRRSESFAVEKFYDLQDDRGHFR